MALSLDDLKRKKVTVVKKNNDTTGSPTEVRQKIPPFRIDDSTRADQITLTTENTNISLNDAKLSPLTDAISAGIPMDNIKNDDFREPSSELTQTSNKLITKTPETSNNTIDKLVTTNILTSNKLVTKTDSITILDNKNVETSNKLVTKTPETSNTTHNKTSNKSPVFVTSLSTEVSDIDFDSLIGLKRQILCYIFDRCYKNINLNKTNNTGPLTKEQLSEFTGKNSNVIHVYLHRLIKDNLIIRVSAKEGRGGYSIFTLPQKIYQEILYTQGKETSNKLVTQLVTQLVTTPSSKIDSIYNNTNYLTGEVGTNGTQTIPQPTAQNLGWFKSLDFSAIPYIKPMMVNSAIRALVETKLNPDDVQMFINKFKNWLVTQNRIQNPLAIFCDKLKEFANEGDSPVLAVMSDEEMQVEYLMAQELEKKRAEMNLINKARAFKQEQDKETKFQEWLLNASDEEKKSIYPESGFAKYGSDIYNLGLKQTYLDSVKIG